MWAINVTGTFLCTRYALEPMVHARYGRIVNLSSQLARAGVGSGGFAAYCAVFLAAEQAHYLTGQVLQPNGGWVMA
jgi:NAD(P)-dependent dehydrogenase (short-subunit alcohol dehydrogenase family)